MSHGAHLIKDQFFSEEELSDIINAAKNLQGEKSSTHQSGKYKDIQWFEVKLKFEDHSFLEKMYSFLGVEKAELCVFYYLSPTAKIHPHRDLTGASYNARIRFHVPVITNDGVDFKVSKKKIKMLPGQLWALDTSYLHSVENSGHETRVHLVIECDINEKIKQHLPARNVKSLLHDVFYVSVLAGAFLKSITINLFTDPKYFIQQMKLIGRFIKWRVLGDKTHLS